MERLHPSFAPYALICAVNRLNFQSWSASRSSTPLTNHCNRHLHTSSLQHALTDTVQARQWRQQKPTSTFFFFSFFPSSRKPNQAGEGADGVAAWSTEPLADFAVDQQLQGQAHEAAQAPVAAQAALRTVDLHGPTSQASANDSSLATAANSAAAGYALKGAASSRADTQTLVVDGSPMYGGQPVLRNALVCAAPLRTPLHKTEGGTRDSCGRHAAAGALHRHRRWLLSWS